MELFIDDLKLQKLDINSKPIMEKYLLILGEELNIDISDYTFSANFIWIANISGFYGIVEECFCLFVMQANEIFMLLPPLGKLANLKNAIIKCFEIMNAHNSSTYHSHIDYVAEAILEKFAKSLNKNGEIFDIFEDFIFEKKLVDYIYKSDDLIELKGNPYHTKRTEINKFKNTYPNYQIKTLVPILHKDEIIKLSRYWMKERIKYMPKIDEESYLEGIYQENAAIKRALENYEKLELIGVVLYINNELKGFSIGEKINDGVASVLIEKTDFEILGCAQFIFREFCKILKEKYNCTYINVGDDMGFENLKKVKMSYRPHRLDIKYSIYQKNL